jgi:hypothetical protein
VPTEATFSRAFAVFAQDRLPQRIHEAMIQARHGDKLHIDSIDGDLPVSWLVTSANLHDSHGGRHVRVRGVAKVSAHLSFGLLVIAAEQLLNLIC